MTEFEKKVYKAVMEIPVGETRSYQWVAARIGRPRACRAVGNALNRNPYAPLVPCHRVVKSDGSLGGFAGGSAKKRRLLAMEREIRLWSENKR
ncbi:MAG: methylated-DNA--[protein]-cysteine S-methyltransferase [Deltaproteobacteria bacterium]